MKPKSQILKRIDALTDNNSPSPSPSSALGQVSFEKNRLYYGGETYHLQFGHNKRIMCVTKGDKYALINSPDYTGSRIEAATAVMNGLTEDWDLEFDCDDPNLNISSIFSGYSGEEKREYKNGRLKIKFLKSVPDPCRLQFNFFMGGKMRENGNYLHIGGQFRNIDVYCNLYAEHITFGENIRKINELEGSIWGAPSQVKNGHQHGIPPFVESIASSTFQYSGSGYIYIPESCTKIIEGAFKENCASEIEIEEKGERINIAGAFYKNGSENSASRVQVIKIPARVLQNNPKTFAGSGAGAVVFEEGCTEIKFSDMGCIYNTGSQAMINHLPFYIFIPSTVTSIGDLLVSYPSTSERKVFVIYEGSESSWNNINKASNWNGGNNDVTVICGYDFYRNYENIIARR